MRKMHGMTAINGGICETGLNGVKNIFSHKRQACRLPAILVNIPLAAAILHLPAAPPEFTMGKLWKPS